MVEPDAEELGAPAATIRSWPSGHAALSAWPGLLRAPLEGPDELVVQGGVGLDEDVVA